MIAFGSSDAFGLSRREALWQVGLFIPTKQFGKTNAKQAKDLFAPFHVRFIDQHLPVEPTRPEERRVEHLIALVDGANGRRPSARPV